MYVEASQGGLWDLASLESPWLRQSAATCVVSFWYHMYGKGIGTLYAYVKVGLTYSKLFEEYGTKGQALSFFIVYELFKKQVCRPTDMPYMTHTNQVFDID